MDKAKIKALVLVKNENAVWQLGRITAIYPGRDNITRVAEVVSGIEMLSEMLKGHSFEGRLKQGALAHYNSLSSNSLGTAHVMRDRQGYSHFGHGTS
ncbi:hypothetical protein JTB14_032619 [Gonioctena quinquepunctata]|nr:hypothetical protein JTB14_032619 [Gonioctena quinquepunctata]